MTSSPVAPAAPIPLGSVTGCVICGLVALFRVRGVTEERACAGHVGDVADRVESDGWAPLTLHRIFPARGVA